MYEQLSLAIAVIGWALFLPACFAINMSPGPNNLTGFVNGARLPIWQALIASQGRQPAFAILITASALGLGVVLATAPEALWAVKIIGAFYLAYIGFQMFRAGASGGATRSFDERAGYKPYLRQDFMFAISNPKAIATFTAFFPQFLSTQASISTQLFVMGVAFLVMEMIAAATYVLCGRLTRGAVERVGGFGLLQKGVGLFLIFSGVALAFAQS